MNMKTLPLALSALLLSGASLLAVAADEPIKPTANQGTSMSQPDKAKSDQGTQANESTKPDKDVAAQMKALDPDGDGTVDKAEAGKMKGLTEVFDVADKNKDGKLDAGELAMAISKIKK